MLYVVFFLQNTNRSTTWKSSEPFTRQGYCLKKPENGKRTEKLRLHTTGFSDVHEHTEAYFYSGKVTSFSEDGNNTMHFFDLNLDT